MNLAVSRSSERSLRIIEEPKNCYWHLHDDISIRNMLFMKEALFEFISVCNRNI